MNDNNAMMNRVRSHLGFNLRWMGSTAALPYGAHVCLYEYIERLWNDGILPIEIKRGIWVVGYHVYMNFSRIEVCLITVGPAKPSKFKRRHSKIEGI